MKAKKYLILTLAALAALTLGIAGCKKPADDVPPPAPTVTLNRASALLDVYETVLLTAEAANTGEAVVWSASNDVVSVDGGLVRALKEGTATVTASAGGASAACAITVTNSHTAPVLRLSREWVSVAKDGAFTVTAAAEWKGKPIDEPVEYVWAVSEGAPSDIASVTPGDNGAAVIKGLKYGQTELTVSASARGAVLAGRVAVKVCNTDVTFVIPNLKPGEGCFIADVSLTPTPDDPASVTPEIGVYNKGVLVPNAAIVWENENDEVAVMDENGALTALKEGQTTLTGRYDNNDFKIVVNAYRPEIALSAAVEVETAAGAVTLTEKPAGRVTDALLNGRSAFRSYDAATGILSLDPEKLPKAAADMGRNKKLVIETDKASYTAVADVYTKIIRTAEDLDRMGEYAKAAEAEPNFWGGYFVLGNDVAYNKTFPAFISYSAFYPDGDAPGKPHTWKGDGWNDGRNNGFKGIFDGRGYAIDGMAMTQAAGGFIGVLHRDGVIRNVAFTNARQKSWGGFVAAAGDGRIENVYVHCVEQTGGNPANNDKSAFFFSNDCMAESRVVRCFVDTTMARGTQAAYGIGATHEGYGLLNGVYCVGTENGVRVISNGGGQKNVYGAYLTYGDLLAAKIDFSGWEGDFWSVRDGIPYPKKLERPAGKVPGATVDDYAPAGGEVEVKGLDNYSVIDLSPEAEGLGVTCGSGKISVPSNVDKGTRIAFSVYAAFDASKKVDLSFGVVESKNIALTDTVDVEVEGGDTFEIDFGDRATELIGRLQSVKIGSETIEGASCAAGVLTVPNSGLVGIWGGQTLTATFVDETDGVAEAFVIATVPLDVTTMIINDEAELNRFLDVAKENAYQNSWGGIFKLGNDVTCTGTYASRFVAGDTRGEMGAAAGFNGTFDGKGFTIYGLHTVGEGGGFAGPLGKYGVVKNVSFVNALNTGNGGFLASHGAGTVENVFVSIFNQPNTGVWNHASSVIVSDPFADFRINKVVVDYINALPADASAGYPMYNLHYRFGIVNGGYAVGVGKFSAIDGETGGGAPDAYGAYDSWAAFKAAGVDFAGWDNDFWNVVNGLPLPAGLAAKTLRITNAQTDVFGDRSYTLTANVGAVAWSTASELASIEGNILTVSPTAKTGDTIVVTAVSKLDDAVTDTITFTVQANTVVTLTARADVEQNNPDKPASAVDLSGAGENLGTLVSAKLGETDVRATLTGSVLSVTAADFGNAYGEQTLTVMTRAADGSYRTIRAPVLVITKVMRTADDVRQLGALSKAAEQAPNLWGGYFVLGGDVDFAGGTFTGFINYETLDPVKDPAGGWNNGRYNGFKGTIDGRGHKIDNVNMAVPVGGLVGVLGQQGVVKNLALTNVAHGGLGGVIAHSGNGRIENVYLHIKSMGGGTANDRAGAFISTDCMGETRLVNCFAKFDAVPEDTTNFTGLGSYHLGFGILTNVYCVGVPADRAIRVLSGEAAGDKYGGYPTAAEFKAAVTVGAADGWDTDFWTTDADGLPIPKSMAAA